MNVAAMPLSRKKIRNLAFELRKIMGWDDEPYFPIVHFIEWILANPHNITGSICSSVGILHLKRFKIILEIDLHYAMN